ncbi:UNVERIFIED_CONTAM: hypothetical protein GTU68_032433 [Idotea baltica]|nr:hypothetical protein [Idotea baltica]
MSLLSTKKSIKDSIMVLCSPRSNVLRKMESILFLTLTLKVL